MKQLVILLIIVFLILFFAGGIAEPGTGSPAERSVRDKKSSPGESQRMKRDNFIADQN